jgi:ribonuclease HII
MNPPTHDLLTVGVDEVGRGCLAGSVVAAAVILPSGSHGLLPGLTDSKKLSAKRRQSLAAEIERHALDWTIGRAEPSEIDRYNILQATLLAMQRAYDALKLRPTLALVDGRECPDFDCPVRAIVGGDLSEPAISAASILAKVYRDHEMQIADAVFPGYGFGVHKGYPTREHRLALQRLGPSPLHRQTFGPVRKFLDAVG